MKSLSLDEAQRIHVFYRLAAEQPRGSAARAIWKLMDKIELSKEEKVAVDFREGTAAEFTGLLDKLRPLLNAEDLAAIESLDPKGAIHWSPEKANNLKSIDLEEAHWRVLRDLMCGTDGGAHKDGWIYMARRDSWAAAVLDQF